MPLPCPPAGWSTPWPTACRKTRKTKRRLENLLDVTGLIKDLRPSSAAPVSAKDLARVHPSSYLETFKALSDQRGGDLGLRAPFGQGGYEIATLSTGLASTAQSAVLRGRMTNACAL